MIEAIDNRSAQREKESQEDDETAKLLNRKLEILEQASEYNRVRALSGIIAIISLGMNLLVYVYLMLRFDVILVLTSNSYLTMSSYEVLGSMVLIAISLCLVSVSTLKIREFKVYRSRMSAAKYMISSIERLMTSNKLTSDKRSGVK